MKMVKSLLLGSAAGLVAVSAGQAADLPVKAKPVEYVKVCSLYGAGFYYMPGTDICLKIGGYVRAETTYHSNGNFAAGPTVGLKSFNRNTQRIRDARPRLHHGGRTRTDGLGHGPRLCRGRCRHDGYRCGTLHRRSWASTAPSSNGPASRLVSPSRSMTSIARLPLATGPITRAKIPATPAGGYGPTPPSSAMACRRRSRPNSAG